MEIKVKISKLLLCLVVLIVASSMQAQEKMSKKQYKQEKSFLDKSIAEAQKDSLVCAKKKEILTRLSKRKAFKLANPQEVEKRFLFHYGSLNELIKDSVKVRDFLKWLPTTSEYAQAYLTVFDMSASLYTIYDAKTNNKYCDGIAGLREKIAEKYRDEFDELSSKIKDYNFVMFELARVIAIIDKSKSQVTYNLLKKKGETEFLDNIPYAKKCLNDYIGVKSKRQEIKRELKKACPEAFE